MKHIAEILPTVLLKIQEAANNNEENKGGEKK